jgi:hypothetical protein
MCKLLKSKWFLGVLLFAVICSVTVAIAASADNNQYAVNENGESYGSAARATSIETEPDLIAVVGVKGLEGYVKKSDLYRDDPQTAEEMEYYMAEVFGKGPRYIPVYESDGKTAIDEFMIGVPPSKEVAAVMGAPDGTKIMLLADGSYMLPDGTELVVMENGDLALPDGTVLLKK